MFFRSFSVKVDFAESSFLRRVNVHPAKSSDPKINEHSVKKHAKNVLEKVMRKTWNFHERHAFWQFWPETNGILFSEVLGIND